MGTSSSHQNNLEAYIQLKKDFYIAGQYLDGVLFVNCTKQLNYKNLQLRFICTEKVFWSEGSSQNTLPFRNNALTYNETVTIKQFQNGLTSPGQFSCPFKILLPSGLPGSVYQDQNNQIKYRLIAELVSDDFPKIIQKFSIIVNIIEPFRNQIASITQKSLTHIKGCSCFGCFQDYGSVGITVSCDKNYINPGKFIKIKVNINNIDCLINIKKVRVLLIRNKLSYVSKKQMRDEQDKILLLKEYENVIPSGTNKNFQFIQVIPKDFSYQSTSIGSIIAVYFTLKVVAYLQGCTNVAESSLHLIYHAQFQYKQPFQNNNKYQMSPILQTQVISNLMKGYKYAPVHGLSFHNRGKQNHQKNDHLSRMTEMSYYSEKVYNTGALKQNLLKQQSESMR